jgi:hypothetical protein
MRTDEKIIMNKVGLLKLSELLGSASEACKVMAIPATAFTASRSCTRPVASWHCARSADASLAPETGSKSTSRRRWSRSPWISRPSARCAWPTNSPDAACLFPRLGCVACGCGMTWKLFVNDSRHFPSFCACQSLAT